MSSAEGLPRDYFEKLYEASDDPWSFATRWYEKRKRCLTLAMLPRESYRSVLELGGSIGVLTSQLAARADSVVSVDISQEAVELAKVRLTHTANVRVQRRDVREGLPDGDFDLIVVSEVAYYLSRSELQQLGASLLGALGKDGDVLLCHWRHPVEDYPLGGDEAHGILVGALGLNSISRLQEQDVIIEVLSRDPTSVARREGLR